MTNTYQELKFKPLAGQIMCAEIETDGKVGNIYLPEKMAKPSNQGVIVAIGEDVPITAAFAIGFTIVWPAGLDSRISFDRKQFYRIINYTDVILSDFGYFATLQKDDQNDK